MDVESRVVAPRWWRVGSFLLSILLAPGALAQVVFNVNSDADQLDEDAGSGVFDGVCNTAADTCTLRAAVMEANRVGGPGATIQLPAGTYKLTRDIEGANGDGSGDLNLTPPGNGNPVITIAGAGAGVTIIDAQLIDRVFRVDPFRTAIISGVTLMGGRTLQGYGGAILNMGTLTMRLSVLSGNFTEGSGGAIYHGGNQTLVVDQCTLSGNIAFNEGGAMSLAGGTVDVIGSTLYNNFAARNGGAINNDGNLFVTSSTLSGNGVDIDGGGIYNYGTVNMYSSTVAFNQADVSGGQFGDGGGITNVGTFNLRNSVVAGNRLAGLTSYDDCEGSLTSYGRNKFWAVDTSRCAILQVAPGDVTSLASLQEFGALQDNGGPTATHALAHGSSMIDGAEPIFGCTDKNGATMTTDQRGAPRVAGVRCDIGAYEFGASLTGVVFVSSFESGEP